MKINSEIIKEKCRFIRNYFEKKKNKNKNFTIICNTCIGGVIYHDLGLIFNSPTINLYIQPTDFIKFVSNIDYFLDCELNFTDEYGTAFPVGILGDGKNKVKIYFVHYKSKKEARYAWEKRKIRINYDNIYIIMTSKEYDDYFKLHNECDDSVLEKFSKLPYKNKVCFIFKKKNIDDCVYIYNHNSTTITKIMSFTGKRLYQYAKDFDYLKFLNIK